jgi:hypothetical protein
VTILAMLVALNCVAVSLERLRRVHRAAAFDLAALSTALGRTADAQRLSEMRDLLLAEGTNWEGELVADALSAKNEAERTALVNEHLGDVASDLGWGARIPVAAARMSAMAALCILFVSLALSIGGGAAPAVTDIVSIIGWGGAGVLGALATGREADRVASEIRRGVDTWVARVLDAANGGDTAAGGGRAQ